MGSITSTVMRSVRQTCGFVNRGLIFRENTRSLRTLSEKTKKIVHSTSPIMKERGAEITSSFYQHVFKDVPELATVFNMRNQQVEAGQKYSKQAQSLANSVMLMLKTLSN